jgi:hypothetical protein
LERPAEKVGSLLVIKPWLVEQNRGREPPILQRGLPELRTPAGEIKNECVEQKKGDKT